MAMQYSRRNCLTENLPPGKTASRKNCLPEKLPPGRTVSRKNCLPEQGRRSKLTTNYLNIFLIKKNSVYYKWFFSIFRVLRRRNKAEDL